MAEDDAVESSNAETIKITLNKQRLRVWTHIGNGLDKILTMIGVVLGFKELNPFVDQLTGYYGLALGIILSGFLSAAFIEVAYAGVIRSRSIHYLAGLCALYYGIALYNASVIAFVIIGG